MKAISVTVQGCIQELHDAPHSRAAIALVLQCRRYAHGLAHVFLRKSDQFPVIPDSSVKPFNGQYFLFFKLQYFAACDG